MQDATQREPAAPGRRSAARRPRSARRVAAVVGAVALAATGISACSGLDGSGPAAVSSGS